jgi:hypothetical protein
LFAITSAFLCSVETDNIVLDLNEQARTLMTAEGIPTVDLHAAVCRTTCFCLRVLIDGFMID